MEIANHRSKLFGWYKCIGIAVLVLFLLTIGVSFYVGWTLTHPQKIPINTDPFSFGISDYENVSFSSYGSSGENLVLRGWFLPSKKSAKTIIFAHGYKQNRIYEGDELWKGYLAKSLVENGYNVFLFDFRNCGESDGKFTSVGEFEEQDLIAAIDYVNNRSVEKEHIALLGFSMGAATCALAASKRPSPEVVIMDSSFADLKEYLQNNLSKWSHLPAFPFNWLILNFVPNFLGMDVASVSPIKAVANIKVPILFIHGDADTKIPVENAKKLFRASNNPKDEIWIAPKADHVEAFKMYPKAYLRHLLKFLKQNS